tara:strand:+ start:401 stop:577 length:177 start_codon:yes stop_codon:yes gene_type:complete
VATVGEESFFIIFYVSRKQMTRIKRNNGGKSSQTIKILSWIDFKNSFISKNKQQAQHI